MDEWAEREKGRLRELLVEREKEKRFGSKGRYCARCALFLYSLSNGRLIAERSYVCSVRELYDFVNQSYLLLRLAKGRIDRKKIISVTEATQCHARPGHVL